MIIAITSVSYDFVLLPHYLRHYRELGVEKFLIAAEPFLYGIGDELREATLEDKDVFIVPSSDRFHRTGIYGALHDEIRQEVANPTDWIIPADLDEFNQYPKPLPELIKDMESGGYQFVMGELVDRIARDGSLPEPKKNLSLWEQFPLECLAAHAVTQAHLTSKVLLACGDVALSVGQHAVVDPLASGYPDAGIAHHFKWRKGLRETLATRVALERKAGAPWLAESERLVRYFEDHGGKFDLSAIPHREGFIPYAK